MKWYTLLYSVCFILSLGERSLLNLPLRTDPTNITGHPTDTASSCPMDTFIEEEVEVNLQLLNIYFRPCQCGGLEWNRIAFFNFSYSKQECPEGTFSYSLWNVAGCSGVNVSITLPVSGYKYSTVCGRIFGTGYGGAFKLAPEKLNRTIDEKYLDGVSLTHGPYGHRRHIWSFAAAWTETNNKSYNNCPCTLPHSKWPHATPAFVGPDYFCDTSFSAPLKPILWDGEDCVPITSCCTFNRPPYFCKTLSYTITEDIEMRIFYPRVQVNLIEIYVK